MKQSHGRCVAFTAKDAVLIKLNRTVRQSNTPPSLLRFIHTRKIRKGNPLRKAVCVRKIANLIFAKEEIEN